jgi:hypothetical protein
MGICSIISGTTITSTCTTIGKIKLFNDGMSTLKKVLKGNTMIFKYYEAIVSGGDEHQLQLSPTNYVVYAVGEDLMECTDNVIVYLHTLNRHFPDRYAFTPYSYEGGVCARYYRFPPKPNVDLTLGFYAAEPHGSTDSHWMHQCMQN